MGIETAIIAGIATAGVSAGIGELTKQEVDEPELPDPGLARKQAASEAKMRQQSMARFLARSQQLGPIQLRRPGLHI